MNPKCMPIIGHAAITNPMIQADFTFTQLTHGRVKVDIAVHRDFANLTTAPFPYHIHEAPVSDGCASTRLHLDPHHLNPGGNATTYSCRSGDPTTCEVGDLSGKHGKLDGKMTTITYVDAHIGRVKDLFDQRSVVIHKGDASKERIGCATIFKKKMNN